MKTLAWLLGAWLLLASPVAASETASPISPAQVEAFKRQLAAMPTSSSRTAMMQKLLKVGLAIKHGKTVERADLLEIVRFLRSQSGALKPDVALTLERLEEDLDALKREFEGY